MPKCPAFQLPSGTNCFQCYHAYTAEALYYVLSGVQTVNIMAVGTFPFIQFSPWTEDGNLKVLED